MSKITDRYIPPSSNHEGQGVPEWVGWTSTGEIHSIILAYNSRREAEADLEAFWKAIDPATGHCSASSPLNDTFTNRSVGFRTAPLESLTGKRFAIEVKAHPSAADDKDYPIPASALGIIQRFGYEKKARESARS